MYNQVIENLDLPTKPTDCTEHIWHSWKFCWTCNLFPAKNEDLNLTVLHSFYTMEFHWFWKSWCEEVLSIMILYSQKFSSMYSYFTWYLRATGAAYGYKIVFDLITDFRIQMSGLDFSLGSTFPAFHDTFVFINRSIRDNWKTKKLGLKRKTV